MAYLRKMDKSPYWIACYRSKGGALTNRSTRIAATPANRQKAQRIADTFEGAYRAANAVEYLRDNFNRIAREIDPASATVPTVQEYFSSWRQAHGGELAPRTLVAYDQRLRQFSEHVGAALTMDLVKRSHAVAFRGEIAKSASPATANHAVKVLRAVFACAMNDGVVRGNPFALKPLGHEGTERQAFTLAEVNRLMSVADPEWRSLIVFGLYTGQRLGDLVNLTWAQIDFNRQEILFQKTEKTSRRMAIPACDALWTHILTLQRGTPTAPLHPQAYVMRQAHGVASVSKDFAHLLVESGLRKPSPNNKRREREGDVSREVNPLTFHSLRHAAATWLRDAGASESLAMEIVGHDSKSVDRAYVHTDPRAMRDALNLLPKIGG